MNMPPRELRVTNCADPTWVEEHLRWVTSAHYDTELGLGDLRGNYRAFADRRFLCHLIQSALPSHNRQELFRLLLTVARNSATGTRRLKNVGGGVRVLTHAGTPSSEARPRRLNCLRNAKEGIFGYQGAGRGGGCCQCCFNREKPKEYRELVEHCEVISELARTHEPEFWQTQMAATVGHRELTIGSTVWSQGVANLSFPMAVHCDRANVKGSLSALTVFGDFDGGPLIFPAQRVAVFLQPGDLLLFDGHEHHGVGPFTGVRMSLALYLNRSILCCPDAKQDTAATLAD